MSNYNFAVFILTNRRADRVFTYNTLKKCGYTGKIYLIIDDEDEQQEEYKNKYKNEVIIFNKGKAINMTDSGDNFKKRNSVVYARNYVFKIAKDIGIEYFLVLDDDYTDFTYRLNHKGEFITRNIKIKNLDNVINSMLDFYSKTNILTLAMAQTGDLIGGENCSVIKAHREGRMTRKAMNSFFCSADRPFKFMGRINEDVNAYVELGKRGYLFFTFAPIVLQQVETQANSGGLTDIYLDLGTYVKSFYTVMYNPSCVRVKEMGARHKRLHHLVKWNNAVPLILNEKYKKA